MNKNSGDSCIYLDHHATTPLDPRVLQKMMPFLTSDFGNPSSAHHKYGWHANDAVSEARLAIAKAINAHPTEIIFTSGATEATNLALKGLFFPQAQSKTHIISSSIEHPATLVTLDALEAVGISLTLLKPTQDGHIAEKDLVHALKQNTGLVSLFGVNHEIGVINNIQNLGKILKNNNIIFHCDATQALGKITLNCQELPIDMMSFSGHKIYGPKGVGALYVRRDLLKELCPLIHGGGQEWCKRSGTLNVPGIVGLGEAVRLITSEMPKDIPRIKNLRDRLLTNLSCLDNIYINGSLKNRVAHNLNISFAGIDGEELILSICDRVAVSTGSACASAKGASSAVLAQLGVNAELRQATLRFGIGRFNTIEEIDDASELIITQVKKLRKNKFIMLKRS